MTTDATGSRWSLWSQDSLLCIGCKGSVLSVGSVGSVLSIGSLGSAASLGSIGSAASVGSILSFWSRRAVLSSGVGLAELTSWFRADRAGRGSAPPTDAPRRD